MKRSQKSKKASEVDALIQEAVGPTKTKKTKKEISMEKKPKSRQPIFARELNEENEKENLQKENEQVKVDKEHQKTYSQNDKLSKEEKELFATIYSSAIKHRNIEVVRVLKTIQNVLIANEDTFAEIDLTSKEVTFGKYVLSELKEVSQDVRAILVLTHVIYKFEARTDGGAVLDLLDSIEISSEPKKRPEFSVTQTQINKGKSLILSKIKAQMNKPSVNVESKRERNEEPRPDKPKSVSLYDNDLKFLFSQWVDQERNEDQVYELEASFGVFDMRSNFQPGLLSLTDFDMLTQALKAQGLKFEETEDVIEITPHTEMVDGKEVTWTVRSIVESGKEKRFEFKHRNEFKVTIPDMGVRVSASREYEIDDPEGEWRPTVRRVRKRISFFGKVRYDLTVVRESSLEWKDKETVKWTNLKYEVEIEVTDTQLTSTQFLVIITDTYNLFSKGLSLQEREYVATIHNSLFQKDISTDRYGFKPHNQYQLYGLNYMNKPRNIKMEDIIPNKMNFPYLTSFPTVKLNGKRMFMLFLKGGVYMMMPKFYIVRVGDLINKELEGTYVDGEFVSTETENTYYVFDTLFYRGTSVRHEPFLQRYNLLRNVCVSGNVKFSSIELRLKEFEMGSDNIYDRMRLAVKKYKKMVKSDPESTDGIIIQPAGEYHNNYTLKWKPIEQQTIDFYFNPIPLTEISRYSKMGVTKDNYNRAFMLEVKSNTSDELEVFRPKLKGTPWFYGVILLEEDIDPKKWSQNIVECKWDFQDGTFIPVRLREDRLQPNGMNAATGVWFSLHKPIELSTICGKDAVIMRKLHNIVKEQLLNKYLKPQDTIIDIGSGRGGDLNKWLDLNLSEVFAIEPEEKNQKEFKRRLEQINRQKNEEIKDSREDYRRRIGRLLQYVKSITSNVDTNSLKEQMTALLNSLLSMLNDISSTDKQRYFSEELESLKSLNAKLASISRNTKGTVPIQEFIQKHKMFIKERRRFEAKDNIQIKLLKVGAQDTQAISKKLDGTQPNAIVSFFSLTFFGESPQLYEGLLETLNLIPEGGYFIGAVMDGKQVYNLINEERERCTRTVDVVEKEIEKIRDESEYVNYISFNTKLQKREKYITLRDSLNEKITLLNLIIGGDPLVKDSILKGNSGVSSFIKEFIEDYGEEKVNYAEFQQNVGVGDRGKVVEYEESLIEKPRYKIYLERYLDKTISEFEKELLRLRSERSNLEIVHQNTAYSAKIQIEELEKEYDMKLSHDSIRDRMNELELVAKNLTRGSVQRNHIEESIDQFKQRLELPPKFVPCDETKGIIYNSPLFSIEQESVFDMSVAYSDVENDIDCNAIKFTINDAGSMVKDVEERLFIFDLFIEKLASMGFELVYNKLINQKNIKMLSKGAFTLSSLFRKFCFRRIPKRKDTIIELPLALSGQKEFMDEGTFTKLPVVGGIQDLVIFSVNNKGGSFIHALFEAVMPVELNSYNQETNQYKNKFVREMREKLSDSKYLTLKIFKGLEDGQFALKLAQTLGRSVDEAFAYFKEQVHDANIPLSARVLAELYAKSYEVNILVVTLQRSTTGVELLLNYKTSSTLIHKESAVILKAGKTVKGRREMEDFDVDEDEYYLIGKIRQDEMPLLKFEKSGPLVKYLSPVRSRKAKVTG